MNSHEHTNTGLSEASRSTPPPDKKDIQPGEGLGMVQTHSLMDWVDTTWGLVAHGVFSVGAVMFVIFYMDGRAFNAEKHHAPVEIFGEDVTLPFAPIQSDVVTILSSMLVIQKWALTAWVSSLCWRAAILLMEQSGFRRHDLKTLIKYKLLNPGAYFESVPSFVIGTLLLASLAATLSSPILTGSIAWIPRDQPTTELGSGRVWFNEVEAGSIATFPPYYLNKAYERTFVAQRGIGLVGIGWGRGIDKHVSKRISSSVETFPIGSTIRNVTLPYFVVDSIKWIENENEVLPYAKNNTNGAAPFDEAARWSPADVLVYPTGFAALMPSTTEPKNWSSDPLVSRVIEDKRLLVLWLEAPSLSLTGSLPPNIYVLETKENDTELNGSKYAYAWITFRAGVRTCENYRCIISSNSTISTISSDNLSIPEPHTLTFQALSMLFPISAALINQNSSIPYPWHNIDDYVEAVLVRSYSGAWNALNDDLGRSSARTSFYPSLLMLIAHVSHGRVYAWLGLQLSVTFLGIGFLIIQSGVSAYPLIGDTALTAFYLDTSGTYRKKHWDAFKKGTLKIEEADDRMTLQSSHGVEKRN